MLTIEDKIAIAELIARFAHCSDYADWSGLESLFTDDVVTEMDGIPLKYEGVAHGVNVTLGLPLMRTSPDHGTAFDIAGTGRADPSSLIEAVVAAKAMVAATS